MTGAAQMMLSALPAQSQARVSRLGSGRWIKVHRRWSSFVAGLVSIARLLYSREAAVAGMQAPAIDAITVLFLLRFPAGGANAASDQVPSHSSLLRRDHPRSQRMQSGTSVPVAEEDTTSECNVERRSSRVRIVCCVAAGVWMECCFPLFLRVAPASAVGTTVSIYDFRWTSGFSRRKKKTPTSSVCDPPCLNRLFFFPFPVEPWRGGAR